MDASPWVKSASSHPFDLGPWGIEGDRIPTVLSRDAAEAMQSARQFQAYDSDRHSDMGLVGEDSRATWDEASLDMTEAETYARLTSVAYCSNETVIAAWNCTRCKRVPSFQLHSVVYDRKWDLVAFIGCDAVPAGCMGSLLLIKALSLRQTVLFPTHPDSCPKPML